MASNSEPFGEPRSVAGYTVSFMVTTFTNSVARSLDVYAEDVEGESVCLTDESVDEIPDDDAIIDMLELARAEGKLAGPYEVSYEIRSLIDGTTTAVADGSCMVRAKTNDEAAAAAIAWVHDNDPNDDPRIDPVVQITNIEGLALVDYEQRLGEKYLAAMTAPHVLTEADQDRIAGLLSEDERDHLETLPGQPGYDTTYGDKIDQADAEAAIDDEDEDEDDKGEMVYVYQSDLVVLFEWLERKGYNDHSDMTDREAEAWEALDADAGA